MPRSLYSYETLAKPPSLRLRAGLMRRSTLPDRPPARLDADGDLMTLMAVKMSELKAPSGVEPFRIGSANAPPFRVVRAKVPGRPRRLMVALRLSASRLIWTPGMRWMASPTFRSGKRPRPSDEMPSEISRVSRLVEMALA